MNIGSGEEWSIAQTAKLLCKISGRNVEIQTDENRIRPNKSEVSRLLADNTKIKTLTNWSSAVPFSDGLNQTYQWIQEHLTEFDPQYYAT